LWKAVKCDTILNAGAYAPKMVGVACAHSQAVVLMMVGKVMVKLKVNDSS
jgi:hypothetical protein